MFHVFQSAPPRGGRLGDGHAWAGYITVSIRAPAWGATLERTADWVTSYVFQSAPPRGGRDGNPPDG